MIRHFANSQFQVRFLYNYHTFTPCEARASSQDLSWTVLILTWEVEPADGPRMGRDLEKGIHGIVCPYLSMSTINLRDFGSFSWWQIGGYGSDICDSHADGTELGSRSFWRTAILWTQLLLWLLETTDFRPGANAESVPVPRKYSCLLSDSNKGGSWPEAVINDRLPMMDEVERGFKEKYEARSCVEFLGQWGCHMWSVSKKTVHPQV